jgi:spore coat polysaccharide biosynthesis protein SpsF (cytidylyltransferase family)
MNLVAIIQARMGSCRLPGKVLMDLGGCSVLERVVCRLRRASTISGIVVASSDLATDEVIAIECQKLGVVCFRGSELDVLDRYYRAALEAQADAVVRITSDCPLIDPELVDQVVLLFQTCRADYVSNCGPRTFPRGLDTEAFTMPALSRAWREAQRPHQREHVTPYLYENPDKFQLSMVKGTVDYSQYRWTLDTAEDLHLLRSIYSFFGNRDDFGWRDALQLMERWPELARGNSHIAQKSMAL